MALFFCFKREKIGFFKVFLKTLSAEKPYLTKNDAYFF